MGSLFLFTPNVTHTDTHTIRSESRTKPRSVKIDEKNKDQSQSVGDVKAY